MAIATPARPFYHRTSPFWNIVRWAMLISGIVAGILSFIAGAWLAAIIVIAVSGFSFWLLAGRNSCLEIAIAFVGFGIAMAVVWGYANAGWHTVSVWIPQTQAPVVAPVAQAQAPVAPAAPVADPQVDPGTQPQADPADPADPANDTLMSVCDFTTEDAKQATGVDVQRLGTEACGWVWRAVPKAVEEANCPINMTCTLHLENDKKVVVKGDGVTVYRIVAGTFRIWSAYPLDDAVRDACRLLSKEQAFGAAEVPSFDVQAGNFTCP